MNARLIAATIAIAIAAFGCSEQRAPSGRGADCTCAGEPVVDAALLAFLSKARAAHHQADLAETAGDLPRALGALEALIAGPRPTARGALPPEAAEVLADTHARVADLRSKSGAFAAARRDVEQGLTLAARPTHFRGHLFEILGVVHEREAQALEAKGDLPRAAEAKSRALDAFETAIKIQDQVIDDALSGGTIDKRDGG